ncbi:Response regulator MprA [Metalysinibacillus saudimassiliensis]|uniref:Response regulator MprA n=1 Tax=Metalysinibacillus saudimassiliensis TaxID=1461583 RepID=A0A078M2I9_9BACL|nr:Response regulator MprA [Metalysinibacillus saudimassiliensis]
MKILFAEDDVTLRKHIAYLLTHAGYKVTTAKDGAEALDAASAEPFDIIILDWLMPQTPGIEVCQKLRVSGNTAGIMLLTARDASEDIITGLDAGADDYLVKPFKSDVLLARIRALGRRKEKLIVETLTCGKLTLHMQQRTLHKDGEIIELTKNEFSLLSYFMQNSNHVLTREQITAYVWDFEQDVSSNALDALIKLVRKKIDEPNSSYIQTVRGVGYKMQVI